MVPAGNKSKESGRAAVRSILSQGDRNLLLEFIDTCHNEHSASYFNERTYPKLRELLPHEGFAFGRLSMRNSLLYQYVNLGFPADYLNMSSNPQGNIECPILKRWTNYQRPLYYDQRQSPRIPSAHKLRLQAFIDHGIRNLAVHGVVDPTRATATCYTFSRLEKTWDARSAVLVRMITPHLHIVLDPRNANQPAIPAETPRKRLSRREQDVLRWLSHGRSNTEIGMLLDISPSTVNAHIQSIIHKLDATNRVHAVALALRTGVIGL